MSSNWYERLNTEQKEAVAHNNGPMLVLAGAGSGKTTVLVARTGRLIDEGIVKPSEMVVLTFTNKAARELKNRVTSRLGEMGNGLWAGTFHSFGLQLLRKYHRQMYLPRSFGVMDSSDSQAVVKELLRSLNIGGKGAFDASKVLSVMSRWRENGQTRAKSEDDYELAVEVLMPKYLRRLDSLGVVDFDGLLQKPIELLNDRDDIRREFQEKTKQLMVDEFQDTNNAQMQLVDLLVQEHQNIGVVGDDDQSIYGWRGAQVKNILEFPKRYKPCKVVRLERNYRSTGEILELSNAVISKNKDRHGKTLKALPKAKGNLPELFVYENEDVEIERTVEEIRSFMQMGFSAKDIAILYRSNSQGASLEAELRQKGIPYQIKGGTAFFERKETKDVLAYLRCSFSPNEVAFRRILNTPPRGIGDTSISQISKYAESRKISFVRASRSWRDVGLGDRQGKSLEELHASLKNLVPFILESPNGESAGHRLLKVVVELGYKGWLLNQTRNPIAQAKRWSNIEALAGILDRFVDRGGRRRKTIREFVDSLELRDDGEEEEETEEKIQLLTLHAAKGLEFPIVFIVGIEENILPHETLGQDVSEERRLFYVGITRAEKRLVLSRAAERRRYGKMAKAAPSRFLLDLPENLIQEHSLGYRPVESGQRKMMLSDLFNKLDSQSEPAKSE